MFRFEPNPSPNTDVTNYDSTRTFYKVIREKNPENPKSEGFALSTLVAMQNPGTSSRWAEWSTWSSR